MKSNVRQSVAERSEFGKSLRKPLRDLSKRLDRANLEKLLREGYEAYMSAVAPDCSVLLEKSKPVDFGLKVVGVGSVGTRCWIALLEGRDRNDPLFLQMKEATQSALAELEEIRNGRLEAAAESS